MIVGIIGSKDQLVNEYRIILSEKLLNKIDYDIDTEIRTLELLKIQFGESSMQKCETLLNDLIDSRRTNSNIKTTISQPAHAELDEEGVSLNNVDATIISSNFWPPIQDEAINIPGQVDQLLDDYPNRKAYNLICFLRILISMGIQKFIIGMLTNFGSMASDRIHITLKMFCVSDPSYDKSLQQLQSFLSGLVSEEKLALRDGMYFLRK